MNRRAFTTVLAVVLCCTSVAVPACDRESDSAELTETVTVERGDLRVEITASGNLALARTEDLAFELDGTVETVLVEEGDYVEEGRVLARLGTSEWEEELESLEESLIQAEISLDNAEMALDEAEETTSSSVVGDVVTARCADPKEIGVKEMQVELAEIRLAAAVRALQEALEASPEITAPFTGFVTHVNVEGGEEVKSGTVALQLADPDKFEADIVVNEMDIAQVKVGGAATVEVAALSGATLPAEVVHISPTATIQSGVVNYEVKVELSSLEPVRAAAQQGERGATAGLASGEIPEQLKQAIEDGRITQEQVDEMMKRRQEAAEQQTLPQSQSPGEIELREGLTVTVNIVVEEATDVLLVPNGAISVEGRNTYVRVLKDGEVEQRAVTTGMSDWQYTEVVDGLSEGEALVVDSALAASTSTTPAPPQGPEGMAGMGRMLR